MSPKMLLIFGCLVLALLFAPIDGKKKKIIIGNFGGHKGGHTQYSEYLVFCF